jgi:aminoglycoside phosphotransferase (APT) family kinase protein
LLRKLHDAPATLSASLPSHDLAHEVRLTARACEHIAMLDRAAFDTIDGLLERVLEGYARTTGESDTLVHGDYKLDHLWWSRLGLTILDLDSARRADPALDIGKLLADLRWWNAPASCRAAFLDGYRERDVPERSTRARLWEVVWLVKVAARRVPITDLDWTGRTHAVVGLAEDRLLE